jgi:hypothetical protein
MTRIYVPISQRNKLVKESQQRYVSKLVGEGWIHEGVTKMKDISGNEIECVVLVGKGVSDNCDDNEDNENLKVSQI